MPQPKLTAKQARFVAEYLKDLNATQACIRAGYSPKRADRMGHKLVENSRVKKAIQKAQEALSKRNNITADQVISDIVGIKEKALKDGEQGLALKSLDSLAKCLGMYTANTKLEISGPANGPIEFASLSKEERKKRIKDLCAKHLKGKK